MRLALLVLLSLPALSPAQEDLEAVVRKFSHAFAVVEREAADPVEPETAIYKGAIPGMLRHLDPHSVFFDPGQFEQLKELENSTRKGFGTVVSVLPGRVIVLQALPGTPSAKAGIAAGDEIVAINGYRLDTLSLEQLVELLSQSRQQAARLDVRKPGNARPIQFVLTPEEMQAPSVDRAFHLKPGVGYLRVNSFDAGTGGEIKAAIEKLGGEQLKGLVLDLRNNPGGLLPAAIDTLSLFLKPGQVLVTVRGRASAGREERVPATAKPYTFPLAVLVNGRSASASEIVAGALQDHDRAAVVGEPSFGKGLVESVYPLSEGTGLALTTSFYYAPSGRSIQRPLPGGLLAGPKGPAAATQRSVFKTDSGRVVSGGGGIRPDFEVYPAPLSPLQMVLDGTGSFPSFATEYLRKHPAIPEDFEVTPQLLDELQLYLSQRNIRPSVGEWSREREWIRNRLKTEILNQALGVARGDEVEAQRDPQILKALEALGGGWPAKAR